LWLDLMDVENRAEWRRRTRVADPSPEGFNPAWRRERDCHSKPLMRWFMLSFYSVPITTKLGWRYGPIFRSQNDPRCLWSFLERTGAVTTPDRE